MKKRMFSMFLAAVILVNLLPLHAVAADTYPACGSGCWSIVEGLGSVGEDSSYSHRAEIAAANGISGYTGSAAQNTQLLALLKAGRLVRPGSAVSSVPVSGNVYPRYTGSSGSIAAALDSIGVDSSFAFRSRIAAANGITGYQGTAEQNIRMLNSLKSGTLLRPDSVSGGNNSGGSSSSNPVVIVTHEPEDQIYEVCSTSAPLRTGAAGKSEMICRLEKGACLTVVGSQKNIYGNLWYKVLWGDSGNYAYIFGDNLKKHTHAYTWLSDDAGSRTVGICACGTYQVRKSGAAGTGDPAVATAGTLLGLEVAAMVSELGTSLLSVAAAAFPFVAVVSISGMLIYMGVSISGTQAANPVWISTMEDIRGLETSAGVYYKACTTSKGALLIAPDQMDLKTANTYLVKTVRDPAYAAICGLNQKSYLSVWTIDGISATNLAERFSKNGNDFGYGNSNDANFRCEINRDRQTGAPRAGYFEHYHLYYRPYGSNWMKKVCDAHIFYGVGYVPEAA